MKMCCPQRHRAWKVETGGPRGPQPELCSKTVSQRTTKNIIRYLGEGAVLD